MALNLLEKHGDHTQFSRVDENAIKTICIAIFRNPSHLPAPLANLFFRGGTFPRITEPGLLWKGSDEN
jgi:hypothetical protein